MDFAGYGVLTLDADERKWLNDLRNLSKTDKVEYGLAAHGLWVSDRFTDNQPNSVHIPPDILCMDAFSLYHAHTNETLLSVQDLRLLLNPKVEKVAVITPESKIAVASVGYGYRPDMSEFNEAAYQIQMDVGMEIFDNPSFETMSIQERNVFAIIKQPPAKAGGVNRRLKVALRLKPVLLRLKVALRLKPVLLRLKVSSG